MEQTSGKSWLGEFKAREGLADAYDATIRNLAEPLAECIATMPGRTRLVGICGAQGSGKSTLTAVLANRLQEMGLKAAILSLDDVYLSRSKRRDLAQRVHPLLATRGVPGTHDVDLAGTVLEALKDGGPIPLPRFDKATDDPVPREAWSQVMAPVDVVLFEGWCVGARPQTAAELSLPINDLERLEDPDGRWRSHVNDQLAGTYANLFSRLDLFVFLQAPGFDQVAGWRLEQEEKLRARREREGASISGLMDEAGVRRFIAHYERITRALLAEAPGRADVLARLRSDRTVAEVLFRQAGSRAE